MRTLKNSPGRKCGPVNSTWYEIRQVYIWLFVHYLTFKLFIKKFFSYCETFKNPIKIGNYTVSYILKKKKKRKEKKKKSFVFALLSKI